MTEINAGRQIWRHIDPSRSILADAASLMTPAEKRIRKAARNMIARYGDGALTEVNQRIAELGESGRTDTQKLWQKIHKEVQFLLSIRGDGTKH